MKAMPEPDILLPIKEDVTCTMPEHDLFDQTKVLEALIKVRDIPISRPATMLTVIKSFAAKRGVKRDGSAASSGSEKRRRL